MKNLYENNKLVRFLIMTLGIILVIIIIIYLFLKLWIPFGGTPSKEDKKDYEKRSSNYKDGKFYNENDFQMIYDNVEENKYVSVKDTTPKDKIPTVKPDFIENISIENFTITWLGHSTTLLQIHGMNILVDPVFTDVTSPISFVGPKRFSDIPIEIEDLPNIDIVVITHDHYDHLDYKTIKEMDQKISKYIVPLGVENHLERWNVDKDKITNMAWWEEINIDGLKIGCTPARHYSGRSLNDRYNTLWASFVFIDDYNKVFLSGDSGFDSHFQKIYDKYGEFDLSLLDSGQYNNKWKSTHMTPEESVNAGKILNSKIIMPIHWGAFRLAEHPWDDSVERFVIAAEKENIKYITPKIGETTVYSEDVTTSKWWKEIE